MLGVLLIYPHSPLGAARPRESCVYIRSLVMYRHPTDHVMPIFYDVSGTSCFSRHVLFLIQLARWNVCLLWFILSLVLLRIPTHNTHVSIQLLYSYCTFDIGVIEWCSNVLLMATIIVEFLRCFQAHNQQVSGYVPRGCVMKIHRNQCWICLAPRVHKINLQRNIINSWLHYNNYFN